jgi:DNA topoisomerase-1
MMVAQHLYENGRITYMRTDSVNLSNLCLGASKEEITRLYGKEYSKTRQYHTSVKGAQEAHEAIRPTYMDQTEIDGTAQEKRLYELIWKRTIASQMADAEIEKTTVNINISTSTEQFVAQGEVVKFDGFIKVYRESSDDDEQQDEFAHILPPMKEGQELTRREINAMERFSMGPQRYTEASLVHKMEELGIGRPSTYAPTISTIQQREYVQKGDKKGEDRPYMIYVLKGKQIAQKTRKENVGSEKGKLIPTDIGIVVNDFLIKNFNDIMDYITPADYEAAKKYLPNPADYDFKRMLNW